jgi:hypothetical protein
MILSPQFNEVGCPIHSKHVADRGIQGDTVASNAPLNMRQEFPRFMDQPLTDLSSCAHNLPHPNSAARVLAGDAESAETT